MKGAARRLIVDVIGWVLLLVGIVLLVAPGPGLLLIVAGLAVLAQHNEWAQRRLAPMKYRALRGAAEGVETWPRVLMSTLGGLMVVGVGIYWAIGPATPSWWPLPAAWWLVGGAWTGATIVVSGLIALTLIGYSFRRFRGHPEALAELEREIAEADAEAHEG